MGITAFQRYVLEEVAATAPVTVAELALNNGWRNQQVRRALAALSDEGLVEATDYQRAVAVWLPTNTGEGMVA